MSQASDASRRIFLGLGANLGNRAAQLSAALKILKAKDIHPVAVSQLYETEPVGERDQPDFLNQVVEVRTELTCRRILAAALETEAALGRIRERAGGPRHLDVDLLLDGDTILGKGPVLVPHPRLHLRRFVLVPLVELAPDVRHPVLGRTISQLLACCPDRSSVRLLTVARRDPSRRAPRLFR
jgi:2-amino-4-hydroxy-6-hydroxymethyldihydropteridine diphosphokinase